MRDDRVYQAAIAEFRGWSPERLEREEHTLMANLETANAQLGRTNEWANVTVYGEVGAGEAVKRFIADNSRLLAINAMLAPHHAHQQREAERVVEAAGGFRGGALSDMIAEHAHGYGGGFDIACRGQQRRHFDLQNGAMAMFGDARGTLFTRSAGVPLDTPRVDRVGFADSVRQPHVFELFGPAIFTTQGAVKFLKETLAAQGVAPIAEGAKEAEAQISYADETVPVETIRGDLPVTEEQLADVPTARGLIDNRLIDIARFKLDAQLVTGDGMAPNLQGIRDEANGNVDVAATVANGPTDPIAAIMRALVAARAGGNSRATGVILNPAVWSDMMLTNNQGEYTFGSPALVPGSIIWGLPIALGDDLANGKANDGIFGVVGNFLSSADLYIRKDATVEAGWIADDFAKYAIRLRVSVRAALVTYSPAHFVKLTADI